MNSQKARFIIKWITEELMNGTVLIVRHYIEPLNNEAQSLKYNGRWRKYNP